MSQEISVRKERSQLLKTREHARIAAAHYVIKS